MISPYAPLTCADVLVLTDHGTHRGKSRTAVYRRSDGTYLTVLYYDGIEVVRKATNTLPHVESAADEGFIRPARGQDHVTNYQGRSAS